MRPTTKQPPFAHPTMLRRGGNVAVAVALAGALGACGATTPDSTAPKGSSPGSSKAGAAQPGQRSEVREAHPRIVIAYDGGLLTVDSESSQVLADTKHEGFLRLNPAGDGRHVMVSDGDVFCVFDAGVEAELHGEHHHYWNSTPALTDVTYPAPKAGHVVLHDGRTTLFADGSGDITTVDSADIADPAAKRTRAKTQAPHHGVAISLKGAEMLTTQGTEDASSTVQYLVDGTVRSETTDCLGVHGEAAAKPTTGGDVVVFGCENGPVIFRDGTFVKVPVQDAYARTGNLAGSHDSSVMLGDYKVDKAANPERTTRVSLIDTTTASMTLVDLGSPYWFRSLARGPHGEGVVLTGDGKLNLIDVATGTVTNRIDAIKPWQEDADWQKAGPAVKMVGERAYVSDAAAKQIVVIDLESGAEVKRLQLDVAPVELAVVSGYPTGTEPHHHD